MAALHTAGVENGAARPEVTSNPMVPPSKGKMEGRAEGLNLLSRLACRRQKSRTAAPGRDPNHAPHLPVSRGSGAVTRLSGRGYRGCRTSTFNRLWQS